VPWSDPATIVLSPEAMAALVQALGDAALSAASWEIPQAFGPRHRGERLFAPTITILDDGCRASGLPFPLDGAGATRRCAPLVADGTLQGPLADPVEGARLGVEAWRPVPLGEDTPPEHLFLLPGAVPEAQLLADAEEGLHVAELPLVEAWDDGALRVRLVARGLRRIRAGALADPLPDAVLESTLPELLAAVRSLGSATVVVAGPNGSTGGISAPAALLGGVGAWTVA
jgi:predicted Zn-dependent protease